MPAGLAQLQAKNIRLMNEILPEYGTGSDALRNYSQSRGSYLNPLDSDFGLELMAERSRIDRSKAADAASPEERDTSELEAERQKLLDDSLQRGADRMTAMYANLGYGAPPPQFGELSTGEQLFAQTGQAAPPPAYANLLANPAIAQALQQGGIQAAPTSLEEIVKAKTEEIRGAAEGGLIKRYDLGGLVNNMLLQASRTRQNIPNNAVS